MSFIPPMKIRERPTKLIKIVSMIPLVNKWLPQALAVGKTVRTTTTTTTLGRGTIHNTRCGGDERPSGRNDNDHEHNDENGFMGEHQSMYLGETILMTFPTLFVRATLSFMRIAWWRWVESTRPKRKT